MRARGYFSSRDQQLTEQAVVLGVFDLRIIEDVVAMIVMPHLIGEYLVTRPGVSRNVRLRWHQVSSQCAATSPGPDTAQSRIRSWRRASAIFSRR